MVDFDLTTVTVDLASVPLDEVLDFRQQNLEAHKRYMMSVRKFAMALSHMPEESGRLTLNTARPNWTTSLVIFETVPANRGRSRRRLD